MWQMTHKVVTTLVCITSVVYAGICNDKRTDCSAWARDGECSGDNSVRCHARPPTHLFAATAPITSEAKVLTIKLIAGVPTKHLHKL